MSIFSPWSSVMTFLTRLPMGPMHAPLAFTPGWCDATAILVRCPASRAIATISTAPEAISGTSSAKSFFTRLGWVRDSVIAGHLLGGRQDGLHLAQVDQDRTRVLALLDHPGDDVALPAGVLAERQLVL